MRNRQYTPRRFGSRWSKGAPDYVLDVLDHGPKIHDRYDVLLTGPFLSHDRYDAAIAGRPDVRTYANTWVSYIGLTETGAWHSGELRAHECAAYRYRSSKKRIRWADLPACVRKQVRAWAESCWVCDKSTPGKIEVCAQCKSEGRAA